VASPGIFDITSLLLPAVTFLGLEPETETSNRGIVKTLKTNKELFTFKHERSKNTLSNTLNLA